jgi:hypothetical protein
MNYERINTVIAIKKLPQLHLFFGVQLLDSKLGDFSALQGATGTWVGPRCTLKAMSIHSPKYK